MIMLGKTKAREKRLGSADERVTVMAGDAGESPLRA
jgi:hypothetical protein